MESALVTGAAVTAATAKLPVIAVTAGKPRLSRNPAPRTSPTAAVV